MKLLFLSNVFPNPLQPTKGVFNLGMVRALARDHEVRVVSPVSWVDELRAARRGAGLGRGRRAAIGGVEVAHPRSYYPPKVLRGHYGTFLWWSVGRGAGRLVADFAPEAVLGYWAHPDGEVAVRLARRAGVPSVVMVGGSDVLLLGREAGRGRCVRRVLEAADAVVAVSRDLAEALAGLGIPAAKVHVIPRGVDAGAFAPGDRPGARRRLGIPDGAPVLLWVGRLVAVKGLDVLLRACGRLRDRGVAFRLYLVGDGPLRRPLEAQARSEGLGPAVAFVGPVAHDDLPDWYRAADLTVLPSRSEGVPNVLRESLACGTPFVASRVGGVPELAAGGAGELVEPGDPEALAAALAAALARPARVDGAAGSPPMDLADAVAPLSRLLRELAGAPSSSSAPPREHRR
jgi:glycosyltransferase involved in cell wall biosynthesis